MYTFSITRATAQVGCGVPERAFRAASRACGCCRMAGVVRLWEREHLMSSTIETLERELGEAQTEREAEQRAVVRAENAHEAACSARDEAWSEVLRPIPR